MTTKPKTRKAPAAKAAAIDPIFAAITEHKSREKKMRRLHDKLEAAERKAKETHGDRPDPWIPWRHYVAARESGLDHLRDWFLSHPDADREQIEKEYLNVKPRLAAAEHAAAEWDQRAGIAPLRELHDRAEAAEGKAAIRMARTRPTTPAGAGALVAYIRRDIVGTLGGLSNWHTIALGTAASALTRMNKEAT